MLRHSFYGFCPQEVFLRSFNETLVASNRVWGFYFGTVTVTASTRRGHGEEIEKAKSILATEQEKRSEWSKPTLHHQHLDGLMLTPLHCLNSLHSSFHPHSHHSHRPWTTSFWTL